MRNNDLALEYVALNLWSHDREIVLEAVKNNGYALHYASLGLLDDREIVHETIKNHGYNFHYVSENFWSDREFVLEAVKNNGDVLNYVSVDLRNDIVVLLVTEGI